MRIVPSGHADLVVEPVRLDLHEVVVAPEDVGVPGGDLERLALVPASSRRETSELRHPDRIRRPSEC